MKKILQLSLFSILVLISYFFYIYFLKTNEQSNIIKKEVNTTTLSKNQNNLIKNLKYQVKFDNNTQYIITADLSEIIYENNTEIVEMQKVTAQFIDQDNSPLIIKSDYANYNNSNYNTKFYDNVFIKYDDNSINSENLDLNFTENIAKIYNNVVYEGLSGLAKTDNIKIDLITKKVNIFMNDKKKKVELTQQIITNLNPILADYMEKNSISLIIRKKDIIIGRNNLNITKNIISLLNEKIDKIEVK